MEGENKAYSLVQTEWEGGKISKPHVTEVVLFAMVAFSTWANRDALGMASSLQGGIFHFSGLGVSHTRKLRWDWHPTTV